MAKFIKVNGQIIKLAAEKAAPLQKAGFDDIAALAYAGKEDGYDEIQLVIGIQVEMEHTDSATVAMDIAIDHLDENPNYYTELIAAGLVSEDINLALNVEDLLDGNMQKARVVKYIKRVKKPTGKGYYYFYNETDYARYKKTGKLAEEKKSGGVFAGILAFFGLKSKDEAKQKAKDLYAEHKAELAGVDLPTFTDYLNEYLTNKAAWDKRLSAQPEKKGDKKAAKKKDQKKAAPKKAHESNGKKYNLAVMKKIAGWIGGEKKQPAQVEGRVHRQEGLKQYTIVDNHIKNRSAKVYAKDESEAKSKGASELKTTNISVYEKKEKENTTDAKSGSAETVQDIFTRKIAELHEKHEGLHIKDLGSGKVEISHGGEKKIAKFSTTDIDEGRLEKYVENFVKNNPDYNSEAAKLSDTTGIKFSYDEEIGHGIRGIRGRVNGQQIELESAGEGKYRIRRNGNTIKENDSYEDRVFTPEQMKKYFEDEESAKKEATAKENIKTIDKKDFPSQMTIQKNVYAQNKTVPTKVSKDEIKSGHEMFGEKFYTVRDGKYCTVYEATSGYRVGEGKTTDKAWQNTEEKLRKFGIEKLKSAIQKAIDENKSREKEAETAKKEAEKPEPQKSDIENLASSKKYISKMIEMRQQQFDHAKAQGATDKQIEEMKDGVKKQSIEYLGKLKGKIESKDYAELTSILHNGNKSSRAIFEEMTGVKLGATDKSMREAVKEYVGDDKMKEHANKEQKAKDESAKREQDKKDQKAKAQDERIGKSNTTAPLYVDTDKVKKLPPHTRERVMQQLEKTWRHNGKTQTLRQLLESGEFSKVEMHDYQRGRSYGAYSDDNTFIEIPKIVFDVMVSNPNNKKPEQKKEESKAEEKKSDVKQRRVSDMTFDEYADAAWNDDPSVAKYTKHITREETEKRLKEAKQLLEDFESGRVSARDILGKGNYNKKDAKEYITNRIAEEQKAMDTKGKSLYFMKQYYEHAKREEAKSNPEKGTESNEGNGSAQKQYDDAKKTISDYEREYVKSDYTADEWEKFVKDDEDGEETKAYIHAKENLGKLRDAAEEESGQGKMFKARRALEETLSKAFGEKSGHKYVKRIERPGGARNGRKYVYFYNQKQVEQFKKDGTIPPQKGSGDDNKPTKDKKALDDKSKQTIKTTLKKVANILSEALRARDTVAPTGHAVEEGGESMSHKKKQQQKKPEPKKPDEKKPDVTAEPNVKKEKKGK